MLLDSLGPAMGNLPVITNAAIGAAVFANLSITPACGGAAQTFEQMSFVSQSGLASQVNVAAPEFVPALQREDGSYIGSDYSGNLFAIGLDGSVAWQQQIATPPLGWGAAPFVNPLYATADGGAIVTTTTQCPTNIVSNYQCTPQLGTLYTVDQNGNVTSQTADTGAVYSWSGQWYDPPAAGGSLNLLNLAAVNLAGTFWAFAFASGGSPSGTGAAVRHVDIELFWCTAGLCKSNGAGDVNYIYYQDNPSYLPSSTINLTPGQILTVKTEAFKALNAAFNGYNYPVQIGIMGTGTNQVQVTGDQPPMGENGVSCGETKYAGFSVVSWDYYLASMEQAQYALNLELKVPTDGLLAAIGRGIGNTAAHELGHQFNLEGMHDGSIGTYNGGDCNGAKDPSQFTGTTKSGTTIKWGPAAAKSLHQYIFGW
jgi:hypothetical protein